MVEQRYRKPQVVGSIPTISSTFFLTAAISRFMMSITHSSRVDEEEYISRWKQREKMVGENLREAGMEVA